MDSRLFEKHVKRLVVDYVNERISKTKPVVISEGDVYIVWMCKTLQNNKALAATTLADGMYYEITYNGDKEQTYFDVYKKHENMCICEGYITFNDEN